MNSKEIIEFIYARADSKTKLGLDRIKKLLNFIGNPQNNLKFIHIAGTNGKGSTTTMISNILINAGYTVGKFISPFVISFNERIQINNSFITDKEITDIIKILEPFIKIMEDEGDAPSSFEIITACAMLYYKQKKCDIVCLEVGMGGRFDATNVIYCPLVSVITLIDYDHTEILGKTLEEIAFEKCGIIKEKGSVVTYPLQNENALKMIKCICNIRNNNLVIPSIDNVINEKNSNGIYSFDYMNEHFVLGLMGKHQIYNSLIAIETAKILQKLNYNIKMEHIITGIKCTKFPARLEIIAQSPLTILDGSHNESGAETLQKFVLENNFKHPVCIIGMIEKKEHEKFLQQIANLFEKIITVPINNENRKGISEIALENIAKKYMHNVTHCSNYMDAYNMAKSCNQTDAIIITGSLYLASDFRKLFNV